MTPYRRDSGPAEAPNSVSHDITQDVRDWERGTEGHHGDGRRRAATGESDSQERRQRSACPEGADAELIALLAETAHHIPGSWDDKRLRHMSTGLRCMPGCSNAVPIEAGKSRGYGSRRDGRRVSRSAGAGIGRRSPLGASSARARWS